MQAVTITQITPDELGQLIENAVQKIFSLQKNEKQAQEEADKLLTVEQTAEFLSLSVPTIYGLTSKGELPVMKRGKRCYFSKQELMQYLKEGRKKTNKEMEQIA